MTNQQLQFSRLIFFLVILLITSKILTPNSRCFLNQPDCPDMCFLDSNCDGKFKIFIF